MRRITPAVLAIACTPALACLVACTKEGREPTRSADATSVADATARPALADAGPGAAGVPSLEAGSVSDAPASAPAPADEPPVHVKVVTIGMHVGGGPYDDVTKEPIKRSVEPHFPELARCWKHVTRPAQADVGVDLVIEATGGRARVSNPRATITGEGFVPCVVAFFENVDFQKPRNGRTVVSYSVRFTPS